jgi:hypothetical protein
MRNNDVNAWFPGLTQSGIQRGQLFKKPGEGNIYRSSQTYKFLQSFKIGDAVKQ